MRKPVFHICENKGADQLCSNFVFATWTVQFLFFLNPKFPASSLLLCLYNSVCVRPVRKPNLWFSHDGAQICISYLLFKHMSRPMGKPTICIGENKGADQLRGNRKADQRLYFRYTDSTIPLLYKSKISSF